MKWVAEESCRLSCSSVVLALALGVDRTPSYNNQAEWQLTVHQRVKHKMLELDPKGYKYIVSRVAQRSHARARDHTRSGCMCTATSPRR